MPTSDGLCRHSSRSLMLCLLGSLLPSRTPDISVPGAGTEWDRAASRRTPYVTREGPRCQDSIGVGWA